MPMIDRVGTTDTLSFKVIKETRIVRDDKVAILYSPGYGAGWFTWHHVEALLRDPEVVHLVECREKAEPDNAQYYNEKIIQYCNETYGKDNFYGGADQLQIEWVELGDKFRIQEYEGAETIEYLTKTLWMEA